MRKILVVGGRKVFPFNLIFSLKASSKDVVFSLLTLS